MSDAPESLGNATGPEGYEPRGVRNPRIVDLIALDEASGEVILKLLEDRPWDAEPEQVDQLEEKLSNYFVYVLDGHMARQYPQYFGRRVRVVLECVETPSEAVQHGLLNVATFAEMNDMQFEIRVVRDPFRQRAPWEE